MVYYTALRLIIKKYIYTGIDINKYYKKLHVLTRIDFSKQFLLSESSLLYFGQRQIVRTRQLMEMSARKKRMVGVGS